MTLPGLARGATLRSRFRAARPFRHVVIDGLLSAGLARAVARELLRSDDARFKATGDGLMICRRPEKLGPAFRRLSEATRSKEFLERLGGICGVPRLRFNRASDCGGLFVYKNGAELDPHLDSNDVDVHCAQVGHYHKILLLLYLTPGWRASWGGQLDLYADTGRPPVKSVAPLFNRCVLFASDDRSWHGVRLVDLPPGKKASRRAALILNFYSTDPAGAAKDSPHYNIFMPRCLPARLRPGKKVRLPDLIEAARLLRRRDDLISNMGRLEYIRRHGRAPSPRATKAGALGFLDALPAGVSPGKPLTRHGWAALRGLFSARDRELRRLYKRQYAVVRDLKKRAPELLPRNYY